MKLRNGLKLCCIGRIYDPQHPTCRTCQVGCALKAVPAIGEIGKAALLTPKTDKRGKPNKTEQEYATRLGFEFPGCTPKFEALTFRLGNGHRYTPDWVLILPDGLLCIEVKARGKNGFRHPSYQRAKLAFDQTRLEYPMVRWRWAEKQAGEWDVEDYE